MLLGFNVYGINFPVANTVIFLSTLSASLQVLPYHLWSTISLSLLFSKSHS